MARTPTLPHAAAGKTVAAIQHGDARRKNIPKTDYQGDEVMKVFKVS